MIYPNIISNVFTNILRCSYHDFPSLGHVVEVLPGCLHGQETHRLTTDLLLWGIFLGLP